MFHVALVNVSGCSFDERVSSEDFDWTKSERGHGLCQAGHLRLALQQGGHFAVGKHATRGTITFLKVCQPQV